MKFHNGFEKTWYFSNNKRSQKKFGIIVIEKCLGR